MYLYNKALFFKNTEITKQLIFEFSKLCNIENFSIFDSALINKDDLDDAFLKEDLD